MKRNNLIIREATPSDKQSLANLIHFETHVHRHLEWRPPLDWIGHPPYLVVQSGRSVQAALACPPDPATVAWIRLFAVISQLNFEDIWQELWHIALEQLNQVDRITIAAIPLQHWFRKLLQETGLKLVNQVMVLVWENTSLQKKAVSLPAIIRPMNLDDLALVTELDAIAFDPLWHNSRHTLELAYHQNVLATVVELGGHIVGYQISTANNLGGHLARLAVEPRYQKKGIGYLLLQDLLAQFERRGARQVTVNTQADNLASLALYYKAGFRKTGETYPVFVY